jgi:putative Holliday junction resolvase
MAGTDQSVLTVLGFDVGSRRIGVAVGNTLSASARPVGVLDVFEQGPNWSVLDSWIREWAPGTLVIGNPIAQDGGSQPAQVKALAFARAVSKRYNKAISLIDERNSSIEAAQRFAQSRARGESKRHQADQLDAWAAVIILERWFLQPHHRSDLDAIP